MKRVVHLARVGKRSRVASEQLGVPPSNYKQRASCRKRQPTLNCFPLKVERSLKFSTEPSGRHVLRPRLSAEKPRGRHRWKKGRHEGRHSLDSKAAHSQLPDEFRTRVAPNVMRLLIEGTPKPRVLRNESDHSTTRPKRFGYLAENNLIFLDVLKDVECSHDVEDRFEWEFASVQLNELDIVEALACEPEALLVQVASDNAHCWEGFVYLLEHVARSRAQLEEIRSVRKVVRDHRDDQPIACPKPEALRFHACELFKRIDGEASWGAHGVSL
jgi:hypothetical protein